MQDVVIIVDQDWIITDANQPVLEVQFGYDKEDILNKKFGMLQDIGQKSFELSDLEDVVSKLGKKRNLSEMRFQKKNGDVFNSETFISKIDNDLSDSIGYFIVIRDITERKEADKLLKESEKKYHVLFDSMPMGITVSDKTGNILESNSISEELLGISKSEHVQRSIDGEEWTIVQPDGTLMADNEYASVKALKENRVIGNVEMGIVKTADHITWINVSATPIPLENYGVLVTYSDITDQKKAQEKLQASLKEKETLLHEVHHRVKNNMAVISSLLKLQANNSEDNQTKEILKESQSRVYAMSAVHETLHGTENLSEIDLKSYTSKITTSIFQAYSTDHRKVKLNSDVENLPISINQAYPLGLTINELMSNSLKYAFSDDRKGKITVNIKKQDKELELTVMDDGIGMPEDVDWKNSSTLGLKLVRTLVENQLDGSIDMESNNGTKFTIKFNIEV